jgi:hypothetical protein
MKDIAGIQSVPNGRWESIKARTATVIISRPSAVHVRLDKFQSVSKTATTQRGESEADFSACDGISTCESHRLDHALPVHSGKWRELD